MDQITPGRIVDVVLADGPFAGEHRPAIITQVWNQAPGTVSLVVFKGQPEDGCNALDKSDLEASTFTLTSVPMGTGPRTWRWPERN